MFRYQRRPGSPGCIRVALFVKRIVFACGTGGSSAEMIDERAVISAFALRVTIGRPPPLAAKQVRWIGVIRRDLASSILNGRGDPDRASTGRYCRPSFCWQHRGSANCYISTLTYNVQRSSIEKPDDASPLSPDDVCAIDQTIFANNTWQPRHCLFHRDFVSSLSTFIIV